MFHILGMIIKHTDENEMKEITVNPENAIFLYLTLSKITLKEIKPTISFKFL